MDQATQLRNLIRSNENKKSCAAVITVTSGKGGVGKTNVSVNLAIQMSRLGKRVIIMDADFGLSNVEVMFGIRPKYNLSDLIFKNKDLKDIICEGVSGIKIISGGSGIEEMANLTRYQIKNLTNKLAELDNLVDVIIIDTGAGISDAVLEFVVSSSQTVLVTTPEPTSITDAYALLKALDKRKNFGTSFSVKMLANRVNSYSDGKELYEKLNTVVERFLDIHIDYLGAIPQDSNVSKSVMRQVPFSIAYPHTKAASAVKEITGRLLKNEGNMIETKTGISYLFSRLIHKK